MNISRLFNDKAFFRTLFVLALPIMFQNLLHSLVNMLDTIMIGRLGTIEIAAVGLGNQVFFLLNMILFGAVSGAAVFTAQYWGKKDTSGIRQTTGLALIIVLSIGTLFTLLCLVFPRRIIGFYSADPAVIEQGALYLRAMAPSFIPFAISFVFMLVMRTTGKVKLAMTATAISLSLNAVGNYVLIFGPGPFPELGVQGAGYATVLARWVELAIVLITVYGRRYVMAGTLREFLSFDRAFAAKFVHIVTPVIINELFWAFGVTMQNVIFARTGTAAMAAFNITVTVSNLAWFIFIGLGNGASVMVGNKIGEGNREEATEYAWKITRFSALLAAFVGVLLLPLSRLLPLFFNIETDVLRTIYRMFIILMLTYPFRAFNMSVIIGVLRAGGDTRYSIVFDLVFMWTVSIPLAAAASFLFGWPAWVIYLCLVTEEPLKTILGYRRLSSGKWLHDVT